MKCPLCYREQPDFFTRDDRREYFRCRQCGLTFVPTQFHLTPAEEKSEYDRHQNSPGDSGYRKFLGRLFGPVCERVPPQSSGLDFGAGPGPTLSVMFEEAGHAMAIYDPIYAPDTECLKLKYDFVTVTEVVEHFRDPRHDFDQLWSLVKPGGLLGIMTKLALDRDAFDRWHYKDDPTHISFFSVTTLQWLATSWNAKLERIGSDVALWTKQADD